MFGRKSKAEASAAPAESSVQGVHDPRAPKGRPTPSRKEAEAARRDARRIPADPKEAKRAQKERARRERVVARQAMMEGDERFLPKRDAGPVRSHVRDWIDRRRRLSEYFIFIAFGIMLAAFIPNPKLQTYISLAWFVTTGIVALEMLFTLIRLNADLKRQWPVKQDRKGSLFYGAMRALQVRKLRVPAPRVKGSFRPKA